MGVKERQERDREAVRRAILDAARDLFVREGFEQVSMRKIAELVEYSPAAIYGYFPSKDDIFFALADEGFRLLHGDRLHDDALEAMAPIERVKAIFWRLYVFSCEHPQYFALMFLDRAVPRISQEYERFRFAHEMKQSLMAHVAAAIRSGDLPAGLAPEAVVRIVSCALIGVASMRLSDRIGPDEDATAVARDVLTATLAGLHSMPASQGASCRPAEMTADIDTAGSPEPAADLSVSSDSPVS
jgi:AcrR family transcriptional regulator